MKDYDTVGRLIEEDAKFTALLKTLPEDKRAEADYLYQEGVRVADIAKKLQ
jgi:DNA-directed RNA polymerase specialized sigma24 family protein